MPPRFGPSGLVKMGHLRKDADQMKTNLITGEQKMKATAPKTTQASEPENGFLGIRRQIVTAIGAERIAQLLDLAHDGDETAAAELELIFA